MILDMLDNGSPSHIAIAVSGAGPVVTYDQLRRQVDSFAASLNQVGLGRSKLSGRGGFHTPVSGGMISKLFPGLFGVLG